MTVCPDFDLVNGDHIDSIPPDIFLAFQRGEEDAMGVVLAVVKNPIYASLHRHLKSHEQVQNTCLYLLEAVVNRRVSIADATDLRVMIASWVQQYGATFFKSFDLVRSGKY